MGQVTHFYRCSEETLPPPGLCHCVSNNASDYAGFASVGLKCQNSAKSVKKSGN